MTGVTQIRRATVENVPEMKLMRSILCRFFFSGVGFGGVAQSMAKYPEVIIAMASNAEADSGILCLGDVDQETNE